MRLTLAATVLALGWAASAWANDWGFMATISNTMGIQPNRLCMGEGSRGDIGCPAYAPYVSATSGRVGIGTDSPSNTFHIVGSESNGTDASFQITTGLSGSWQHLRVDGNEIDSNRDLFLQLNSGMDVAIVGTARLGVGVDAPSGNISPMTAVDISGTIKIANGGEACDANRAGAMRYTSASTFDFCDGVSGWRSLQTIAASVPTDRLVSGSSVATLAPSGNLTLRGGLDIVTGTNVVTVGARAGQFNSGTTMTAVGYAAGENNVGSNVTTFGSWAGQNNSGNYVTALGQSAAVNNTGVNVTAVGQSAAINNVGTNVTAIGQQAAALSSASNVTALGLLAGSSNVGDYVTLAGQGTGQYNSGTNVAAFGAWAGANNSAAEVTAIGSYAAQYNTGSKVAALGGFAARNNVGADVTAVGYAAARYNASHTVTAIGTSAAHYNSASNLTAVGRSAGYNNTGLQATMLGTNAGFDNTYNNVTLLGYGVTRASKDNQVVLGNASIAEVSTSGIYAGRGVSVTGGVTATYFTGDGSRLTGLPGDDRIVSGTTNVLASRDRSITITTAGTQRMIVGEDGQIGIGRTNPDATLDVSGTVKVAGTGDETCASGREGTLRVHPVTGKLQICRLYP